MSKKLKKDRKDKEAPVLPAHLEEMRTKVFVTRQRVTHTREVEDPNAYAALGIDNSFSMEDFKRDLRIEVKEHTDERILFDLIGTTAPIANALRRVMLEEVPSMAIEQVDMYQNTSILGDEILAHRLGLIPIKADPRKFQYLAESGSCISRIIYNPYKTLGCCWDVTGGSKHELNTLLFTLDVECKLIPGVSESAPLDQRYSNHIVYSSDLKWVPQGRQAEVFADNPIKAVLDDIVIAELRPGQKIECELFVHKGMGKEHAKWSPVATAFYRLLPEISLMQDVTGQKAEELVKKCPMKVFDLEDLAGSGVRAIVARPRNCSMCRECVREDPWPSLIKLRRDRRHFIFSVESVGAYLPADIVREALKELIAKAARISDALATARGAPTKASAPAGTRRAVAAKQSEAEQEESASSDSEGASDQQSD